MNSPDADKLASPEHTAPKDADSIARSSSSTTERAVWQKTPSRAAPVERVSQLLRGFYKGTFTRKTLKKAEIAAMRTSPSMDDLEREELSTLASSDRTLVRTRKLMLFGSRLPGAAITNQIRDFSGEVLRRHPAFGAPSLVAVLNSLPEAPTEEWAIRVLVSENYSALSWTGNTDSLRRSEPQRCKENAVYCLLLWFCMTSKISAERIQRLLQTNFWQRTAERYKSDTDKRLVLLGTSDSAPAAVSFALVEQQVLEETSRADAALVREEKAKVHAQQAEEQLAEVQTSLTRTQAEKDVLERQLSKEIQAHYNERAHLKDDYEQLRGQVLRRLTEELSLLDDGLHALRREPPKVHIMIDHAERAIDGLKREMERLKEKRLT